MVHCLINQHLVKFIAPYKGIQYSLGFWIPRRGFWIPSTGFHVFCQWNLDSGFLELYSAYQSPRFQIPQ